MIVDCSVLCWTYCNVSCCLNVVRDVYLGTPAVACISGVELGELVAPFSHHVVRVAVLHVALRGVVQPEVVSELVCDDTVHHVVGEVVAGPLGPTDPTPARAHLGEAVPGEVEAAAEEDGVGRTYKYV